MTRRRERDFGCDADTKFGWCARASGGWHLGQTNLVSGTYVRMLDGERRVPDAAASTDLESPAAAPRHRRPVALVPSSPSGCLDQRGLAVYFHGFQGRRGDRFRALRPDRDVAIQFIYNRTRGWCASRADLVSNRLQSRAGPRAQARHRKSLAHPPRRRRRLRPPKGGAGGPPGARGSESSSIPSKSAEEAADPMRVLLCLRSSRRAARVTSITRSS